MLDSLTAPRVSAEWTGLARVFRTEVQRIDKAMDHALATITAPLRARLQHHPRLRHEQIAGTTRLYALTIPAEFRIGPVEIVKDRAAFAISEVRLSCSWLNDDAWCDPDHHEVGLSICRYNLTLRAGRLSERWTPLATISLHALARRVERHHDRAHAALWHDLALLADAGDSGEKVLTPGGYWLGAMIDAGTSKRAVRLRNVRTWMAQ